MQLTTHNSQLTTRNSQRFFAVLLVVCLGLSALLVRRVDQLRAGSTLEDVLYIPSSKVLGRMSLGYKGLVADIYWTRAVQYFGGKHHERSQRYDLLAPLLDITTDLDPKMIVAYQFGSIFLSQKPPEGAGRPHDAVALVEKGIRANPDNWRLYYNLGWIQYSELKDYLAAARSFERGSRIPNASPGLKVLAAAMAQHGGELSTARFLWTQIYHTTDDKMIRANAIKRLQALRVDEDVRHIESAVDEYRRVTGRDPASLAEIEAAGWRGPTVDPVGNRYKIGSGGRVQVQDPDQLPFITRGLPDGTEPSLLMPLNQQQKQAVRNAAEANTEIRK